jgi:hypothetical protein
MKVLASNGGIKVKGKTKNTLFTVGAVKQTIDVPGGINPQQDRDANVSNTETATFYDTYQLAPAYQLSNGYSNLPVSFTVSNPDVGTVDSNGLLTAVSSGTVKGTVKVAYVGERKFSIPLAVSPSTVQTVFESWVTGSLAKHLNDHALSVVSGKTPSQTTMRRFSPTDFANNFTVNPNNILAGVDLSSICAPTGSELVSLQHVAISPRHVLVCNHAGLLEGQSIKFVGTDGIVYTRTVPSGYAHRSIYINGTDQTDLRVVYLSSDLPTQVSKMKVAPANLFTNYLPNYQYGISIFGSSTTGAEIRIASLNNVTSYGEKSIFNKPSSLSELASWWQGWGASSTVWFMVVNGQPMYLAPTHYYQGVGTFSGPFVGAWIDKINTAMTELHGSNQYQLQVMDLSSFTGY